MLTERQLLAVMCAVIAAGRAQGADQALEDAKQILDCIDKDQEAEHAKNANAPFDSSPSRLMDGFAPWPRR
jgi:hypothetical protein